MTIFENPKAFATPLLIQAFSIYGNDLFTLDPIVLTADLQKKYEKVDSVIINRLLAAIGLYTSNLFFQDPIVFGKTCRVLNRHRYENAAEPSMLDICWGITEASLITVTEDVDSLDKVGEGIKKYIKYYANYQGIVTNIPSIPFIDFSNSTASSIHEPLIDAGALENSTQAVQTLEQAVQTNMMECLTQISKLPVALADDAKTQLSQLLRG